MLMMLAGLGLVLCKVGHLMLMMLTGLVLVVKGGAADAYDACWPEACGEGWGS